MSNAHPLLIQVLAQLKPARCGVSDHAILLARELERSSAIQTAFAVVNSSETCDLQFPRIHAAQAKLLETCLTLSGGRPAALLVHLSGYGFSRDGAPLELARALQRVKADGRFRIAVYFHELFASGMPWRSAFWHSRRQKQAVGSIARLCGLAVTNIGRHAVWLQEQRKGLAGPPVAVLPVFSNVGEAETLIPVAERDPVLAVYGLPSTRRKAYNELRSLGKNLRGLGVSKILDIGPEFDAPEAVNEIPVAHSGVLAAADLGSLLAQSRFGFVQHAPAHLAKSGVLAGLCAHGTVPLTAKPFTGEFDGLRDGTHTLSQNGRACRRGRP